MTRVVAAREPHATPRRGAAAITRRRALPHRARGRYTGARHGAREHLAHEPWAAISLATSLTRRTTRHGRVTGRVARRRAVSRRAVHAHRAVRGHRAVAAHRGRVGDLGVHRAAVGHHARVGSFGVRARDRASVRTAVLYCAIGCRNAARAAAGRVAPFARRTPGIARAHARASYTREALAARGIACCGRRSSAGRSPQSERNYCRDRPTTKRSTIKHHRPHAGRKSGVAQPIARTEANDVTSTKRTVAGTSVRSSASAATWRSLNTARENSQRDPRS